jgi:hypothetical protein
MRKKKVSNFKRQTRCQLQEHNDGIFAEKREERKERRIVVF